MFGITKKTNPELEKLLQERVRNAPPMTPEEIASQRASWVKAITTPCEHGVVDFEQCARCRGNA